MSGRALPCDATFHGGRLGIAYEGPHGPVALSLASRAALEPDWSLHLGDGSPPLPVLPRLVDHAGQAVALYRDAQGVHLRALPAGEAVPVAAEARALALASAHDRLLSAVVDRKGLHLRWHAGVAEAEEEPVIAVRRADLLPLVEAVSVGARWMVFYAPSGEAALGVVRWEEAGIREVRYPLRAPVTALHAATTGRRSAVAMGYDDETVELAVLDAEGNMRERPHVAMREPGAALTTPRIFWSGRGFGLTAVDHGRDRVLVRPSGEGVGTLPLEVRDVEGPYVAHFGAGELLLASIEADGDDAALVLRRCERDGGGAQTHRLAVAPPDTALRGRALAARRHGEEARAHLAAALYRDGVTPTARLDGTAGFRALGAEVEVELRVHADASSGFVLEVRAREEGTEEPEAPRSLARLAQWVRTTFSSQARAEVAEDRAFVEARVLGWEGARVRSVTRVHGTFLVALAVEALPDAAATAGLVAATLEHRRRALLTRAAASAKPPSAEGEER